MTLPLSPELLAACWDYIIKTPPACKWELPDSDEIIFKVIKNGRVYGQVKYDGPKYVIEVSSARVGRHETLISTLYHEAIHIHSHQQGFINWRTHHDSAFNKLADQVCKIHEFDRKIF